jgi:hypothetical protein
MQNSTKIQNNLGSQRCCKSWSEPSHPSTLKGGNVVVLMSLLTTNSEGTTQSNHPATPPALNPQNSLNTAALAETKMVQSSTSYVKPYVQYREEPQRLHPRSTQLEPLGIYCAIYYPCRTCSKGVEWNLGGCGLGGNEMDDGLVLKVDV